MIVLGRGRGRCKGFHRVGLTVAAVGLTLSGCAAPEPAPPAADEGEEVPTASRGKSGTPPGPPRAGESSLKVVALIQDNKDRCLGIAREGYLILVEQRENRDDRDGTELTFREYIDTQAAPEIAVAKVVTETVTELLPRAGRETSPGISSTLYKLHDAQRQLCGQAVYNWSHPDTYDRKIKEALLQFNEAEVTLPDELLLNSRQRSQELSAYRQMMQEERMGVVKLQSSLTDVDDWQTAGAGGNFELSAEEYRRKQREWEEHQERMARDRARRDAQVRAQRERRREKQGSEDAGLPRLGVSKEPLPKPQSRTAMGVERKSPDRERFEEAEKWHSIYQDAAWPLRSALKSYSQIKDGNLASQRLRACATLSDTAKQALRHPGLVSPPEAAPKQAVTKALRGFADMGAACRAGNETAEESYYREASISWNQLATWLKGHGLTP